MAHAVVYASLCFALIASLNTETEARSTDKDYADSTNRAVVNPTVLRKLMKRQTKDAGTLEGPPKSRPDEGSIDQKHLPEENNGTKSLGKQLKNGSSTERSSRSECSVQSGNRTMVENETRRQRKRPRGESEDESTQVERQQTRVKREKCTSRNKQTRSEKDERVEIEEDVISRRRQSSGSSTQYQENERTNPLGRRRFGNRNRNP